MGNCPQGTSEEKVVPLEWVQLFYQNQGGGEKKTSKKWCKTGGDPGNKDPKSSLSEGR